MCLYVYQMIPAKQTQKSFKIITNYRTICHTLFIHSSNVCFIVGEERDFSRKIWLLRVYWYTYWYIVGTVYSIQR